MIAAVQLSWQAEQQRGDKCSDHSRYGKLQQEKGTEAIHLIYDPCCVGWVIYWGERGGSMGNQGNWGQLTPLPEVYYNGIAYPLVAGLCSVYLTLVAIVS